MITSLRGRIGALALAGLMFAGVSFSEPAAAQPPAVAISIAGTGKLVSDVKYLLESAGAGQYGNFIDFFAGPYLAELDGEKPAGLLISFDENSQPKGLGFLPVKNLEQMLSKMQDQVGKPEDAGNGVKKIGLDRPMFIKEHKGYVYLSDSQAGLGSLPDDPNQYLGKMPQMYVVAVTVNVRSIPEQLREMAVSEMRAGFERQLAQQESDDPVQAQMQEQMSRNMIDSMVRLVEESDKLMIGWAIDKARQSTYFDVHFTAVPGTQLAKQMDSLKDTKSSFTSFLMPGAAMNMNFNGTMNKEEIDQAMMSMDTAIKAAKQQMAQEANFPNEQVEETVNGMVDKIFTVLKKTIQGGRLDGGMAVLLDNNTPQFVAGGVAVESYQLESVVKDLLDMIKQDPRAPQFTVKQAKHADVTLHLLSAPVPADEDEARAILGDNLQITVGLGPKTFFVGFGKDNVDLVKKAIDGSTGTEATPPMQMNISLKPIISFAAAMEDSPALRAMNAALREVGDKDHVRLMIKSIPSGASYRLEVEEGVLQAVGQAATAASGGNSGGF